MKTPTIEQIGKAIEESYPKLKEPGLGDYLDSDALHNAAEAIHAIIPDNSELVEFIRDDVLDALNDLQNHIESFGWTRHKQAELEYCQAMIEKAKKLIG